MGNRKARVRVCCYFWGSIFIGACFFDPFFLFFDFFFRYFAFWKSRDFRKNRERVTLERGV